MKSTFKWKNGFTSEVDNSRGHSVVMDLPPAKNGADLGATAIEFCAMSLVGCIGTIFAVMAAKTRVEYSQLEIELEASKTDADKTITAVSYVLKIKTDAEMKKIEKCLHLTEENCPVGVLFHQAGVPIAAKVELL